MFSTNIVTSFIKNDDKILILKRSNKVKSMKCLWAGVSGIIEKSGAWIKYDGKQLAQGRDSAINLLREEPKLAKEIEKKVRKKEI